ncbi:ORF72 [Ostreid herpesvirus 1]|uniref:Uncharacterized protein ORF72 n=3 Tax=root TaxID=1 RepID=Y072_OSHVF|nr:ORF72 [Ostreid herpesvirus 1]Q6R7F6.1 RecName: Full=Uncharacterized protein ORF72 [Ostreid herpesvirus 1 (isolate France)]AAS00959.1 ORF72 [Ostreid herpesvirus 1]AHC31316.1 hypothetical protein [Ostreid herpesvirus 1]AHC31317.1 hypothetical protein [Ostreid herpesvirus 1]AHC31318.1 hypothetical protein [Ostreid herpesvirus 1]AHC31319.1 hypothetical protein [Ostreid herpesvirus 1]
MATDQQDLDIISSTAELRGACDFWETRSGGVTTITITRINRDAIVLLAGVCPGESFSVSYNKEKILVNSYPFNINNVDVVGGTTDINDFNSKMKSLYLPVNGMTVLMLTEGRINNPEIAVVTEDGNLEVVGSKKKTLVKLLLLFLSLMVVIVGVWWKYFSTSELSASALFDTVGQSVKSKGNYEDLFK